MANEQAGMEEGGALLRPSMVGHLKYSQLILQFAGSSHLLRILKQQGKIPFYTWTIAPVLPDTRQVLHLWLKYVKWKQKPIQQLPRWILDPDVFLDTCSVSLQPWRAQSHFGASDSKSLEGHQKWLLLVTKRPIRPLQGL